MSDQTKVVVVGGGYAGTLAAYRLLVRPDVEVTLVNPRSRFVERIRLHQLVTGSGSAAVDFARLLNPAVRLVVDEVVSIDAAARSVERWPGGALAYDYLIYVVGSMVPAPDVPEAAEFALRIRELQYAEVLRERASGLGSDDPVCGRGGLTGIETAAELAEQGRSVSLICGGRLGASLGSVGHRLRKLGWPFLSRPW